ncbi:hypothetical protein NUW58_g10233 [Xylaria curta]|uniref:Uncharacterized protein n=1 Tax=Xylaria curta TaxID=42375 RepID=A0ACC1MQ31_9PEZI|nr:hypothetical protein NUW58_g10233 [Xylaria curta]
MLLKAIHVAQIIIAAYGAAQSHAAISRLIEYEDAIQKLAKISSEAERQLHKTRTTQASGAIAILVSFVVSVLLVNGGASYGFLIRNPVDSHKTLGWPGHWWNKPAKRGLDVIGTDRHLIYLLSTKSVGAP